MDMVRRVKDCAPKELICFAIIGRSPQAIR
jgi:hypothetical protein